MGSSRESSGEIFLIDRQLNNFSSKFSTLKKDITQWITKERLEICNSVSGQEEGRSAGYLDVSMMTSKGPSGTQIEDRKGMPGSQGFEIYSESRQEILSRDRKHRRIIYGWGNVVARDLPIRKRFSRTVFKTHVHYCKRNIKIKSPSP